MPEIRQTGTKYLSVVEIPNPKAKRDETVNEWMPFMICENMIVAKRIAKQYDLSSFRINTIECWTNMSNSNYLIRVQDVPVAQPTYDDLEAMKKDELRQSAFQKLKLAGLSMAQINQLIEDAKGEE